MTVPLPELPGVRHAYHDLRTGVRLHVAEAGDPAAPALLAVHGWGPALVRHGQVVRFLRSAMTAAEAAVFARVVRETERARASSLMYRSFLLRELPALAAGRLADARIDLPVKLLFPRRDHAQAPEQLAGVERHVPRAEVELVDGGHLLPDEQPQLVADRARSWFA